MEIDKGPLDFAPVPDGGELEYICSADGCPYPACFARRDGCLYYRRNEDEPWEYVGPVDGRAVIL